MADVAPAVGPESMILPTLNGMKHIDAMIAKLGHGPVVGCVCKVAATIDPAGRIKQLAKFQELAYGELDGKPSARTAAADAALKNAGFEARLTDQITRELWEKWILLASLGGITCSMRGTVGDVAAAAGGAAFALAFIDECVATARAHGALPGEGFIATTKQTLTAAGVAVDVVDVSRPGGGQPDRGRPDRRRPAGTGAGSRGAGAAAGDGLYASERCTRPGSQAAGSVGGLRSHAPDRRCLGSKPPASDASQSRWLWWGPGAKRL